MYARLGIRIAAALAPICLIINACGDVSVDPADDSGEIELQVALQLPASSDIDRVVVEVTADDIPAPLVFNLVIDGTTASGTISIPTGSDRTIAVSAYNAASLLTHFGSVTLDVVVEMSETLSITIMPLMGDIPIEVILGAYSVSVAPEAPWLTVGGTVQLTATVTDNAGTELDVAVVWASVHPEIATVDAEGVVTAISVGEVQIVATYGGTAGSASIVVGTLVPGRYTDVEAFVAASEAVQTVTYPEIKPGSTTPYTENGVTVSSAAGFNNGVKDHTPIIDGYEFGVSGAENINIVLDADVSAFGMWMQDGYDVGDLGGCTKQDSRFTINFKSGETVVAALEEDPPIDEAFFLGLVFDQSIDRVEIREIGSAVEIGRAHV